jgi:hypothetical protein
VGWAILALILGPFAWFILWIYKHRLSGYVRHTDYVQSSRIRRSDIVIDSTLAPSQGGFGQVFRGHLNGSLVAVKEIIVFPLSEMDERAFNHEAKVMRSITHANCVRLVGTCGPPDRFALSTCSSTTKLLPTAPLALCLKTWRVVPCSKRLCHLPSAISHYPQPPSFAPPFSSASKRELFADAVVGFGVATNTQPPQKNP